MILLDKDFNVGLTLIGSSKLGNGGAPRPGKTATSMRMIAVIGIKMATHKAIRSYFVNLQIKLVANQLHILSIFIQ